MRRHAASCYKTLSGLKKLTLFDVRFIYFIEGYLLGLVILPVPRGVKFGSIVQWCQISGFHYFLVVLNQTYHKARITHNCMQYLAHYTTRDS